MISGWVKLAVALGIVLGAALLGGIIGAGVDYASGNVGWWGAVGLAGLMLGMIGASVLIEGWGQATSRSSPERRTGRARGSSAN